MKAFIFLLFWCRLIQNVSSQSIDAFNNDWTAASLSHYQEIKYDSSSEWEKSLMESTGNFIKGLASKNNIREKFLTNLQKYDSLFFNKKFYIIEQYDPSGEYPLYMYRVFYPALPMLSFTYVKEKNSWNIEKGEVYVRKELLNRFKAYKTHLICKEKNWSSVNYESFSHVDKGKITTKICPAVCKSQQIRLFKR